MVAETLATANCTKHEDLACSWIKLHEKLSVSKIMQGGYIRVFWKVEEKILIYRLDEMPMALFEHKCWFDFEALRFGFVYI